MVHALDAYIVAEPNDNRRALLTRSINAIEGTARDQREKLLLAADMVHEFPTSSVKDIAAAFAVEGRPSGYS